MPRTLVLAILLAATTTSVLAQTTAPTPDQAGQLVDRIFRSAFGPNAETQVTYGAVPAALPIRLDPRLAVVASVRISFNSGQNILNRVLLTTALSAEQALVVLRQNLEATGWKTRPDYSPLFGFASAQTVRNVNFYREGNPNFALDAVLTERSETTELDLNINVVPPQAIASFKTPFAIGPRFSLPLLKVFPGASINGTAPVTFPNGALSSTYLKTDRSANEVLSFYSAQLKAAGWKGRTDTADGPLRVVTYSLKDLNGREALGTLGLRPWEKEGGGYVLMVSVQGFKPW